MVETKWNSTPSFFPAAEAFAVRDARIFLKSLTRTAHSW